MAQLLVLGFRPVGNIHIQDDVALPLQIVNICCALLQQSVKFGCRRLLDDGIAGIDPLLETGIFGFVFCQFLQERVFFRAAATTVCSATTTAAATGCCNGGFPGDFVRLFLQCFDFFHRLLVIGIVGQFLQRFLFQGDCLLDCAQRTLGVCLRCRNSGVLQYIEPAFFGIGGIGKPLCNFGSQIRQFLFGFNLCLVDALNPITRAKR